MNDDDFVKAARAAWLRDPATASAALLGDADFVQAIRGCNQHGHKPGCPDANGGEEKKGEIEKELDRDEADFRLMRGQISQMYNKIKEASADMQRVSQKALDEWMNGGDKAKVDAKYKEEIDKRVAQIEEMERQFKSMLDAKEELSRKMEAARRQKEKSN